MIIPSGYKIQEQDGIQGLYNFGPDKFYELVLRVTDYCNYDCSYCHWKYGAHYDFEDIKSTVKTATDVIDHDKFRIYFHGGEPTTHPKLRDIIEFIFDIDYDIIVELQTNLAIGNKYIQSLIDRFKGQKIEVNVSYHHAFCKDFAAFKAKTNILHDNDMLGKVDVMLEHDEKERSNIIRNSKELLKEDFNNRIEFIHSYIDYDNTTDLYKDFVEEHAIFSENYEVTHEDGTVTICDTNDLFQQGVSFKGWFCAVGKEYMIVNGNGDYFMCASNTLDKPIGNMLKNSTLFKIRSNNYTKCKWDCCKGEFYLNKFKQ